MNYRYQFTGTSNDCDITGDGVPAYSAGTNISLDENALNENAGVCGLGAGIPVDWNVSGGPPESSVIFDVNAADSAQATTCGGALTILDDYDDYANLDLAGSVNSRVEAREMAACDNPEIRQ